MKKWYSLVVSVLDKDENRIDAHEIAASSKKKDLKADRDVLIEEVKDGKFDSYMNREDGESLSIDIEIHDYDSDELMEIEEIYKHES